MTSPRQDPDVVIIGSGAAGLACAIAVREMGMDCHVLEKAPKLGGGSALSAGLLWVGANHLNDAAGGVDCKQDVVAYLEYVGADGLDRRKMQTFVDAAPDALRFFEACGMPFRLTKHVDHYYGVAPGGKAGGRIVEVPPLSASEFGSFRNDVAHASGPLFRLAGSTAYSLGGPNSSKTWEAAQDAERKTPDQRGAGSSLVGWLLKLALHRDVAFRLGEAADRLIVINGNVVGVVTGQGEEIRARRGVVIACGGYESNPALVRTFEGLPGWQSMFPESLTGDGLIMGAEHGAAIDTISNNLSVFLGFRNPEEMPDGLSVCRLSGIQELIAPHTIVVNRHGRRFADETFFQAIAPILRVFDPKSREFSNLPCFLIFDQQYVGIHSFAGRPPGAPIPDWVLRAQSIGELAAKLGIAADPMVTTIERFNEDVRSGSDQQFHRGETPWGQSRFSARQTLGALEQPPFYGIELHPTALSSAGLRTDDHGRVLTVRGLPFPGLYAIGNAAARKETGSGYQTGFSLGSALTFGWLAARNLATKNQGASP